MPSRAAKSTDYPKETRGSKIAADIRKETNSLSDEAREDLFKRGMQIIYGGNGKAKAARAR